MANTQTICTTFKVEMLEALHNLNGPHVLKMALYFQTASLGAGTTAYSATGEVTGTNYTAGGLVVANATGMQSSGTTSYWTPSANVTWSNLTVSSAFDCALLYNSTASNRAIAVFTFPAQTANASTFTITMPANVSTSALIQAN